MSRTLRDYYSTPGMMTDPGSQAAWFEELPGEIGALCEVVQGILLHVFWADRLGVELTEDRQKEVEIRAVSDMLVRLGELSRRPLSEARPLEQRLVGNCRDFAVMLCAMLRYQGVPARARCGFGAYFWPGRYEDHWVCETWNARRERWVLVDAQLDDFQKEALGIPFDPLDTPRDQFWLAGRAWQACRAGEVNPDRFGIFDMHGLWFIRGNLVRDILALNKVEILPWDGWGLISAEDDALSDEDLALLDELAVLSLARDEAWPRIRALFNQDDRLRVPGDWPPA
jgi:hypothetical protein